MPPQPSSKPLLSTPTERRTDDDEIQVDFGDLHSTLADYFSSKRRKCLPFLFLASFPLFQEQRTEHFRVRLRFIVHELNGKSQQPSNKHTEPPSCPPHTPIILRLPNIPSSALVSLFSLLMLKLAWCLPPSVTFCSNGCPNLDRALICLHSPCASRFSLSATASRKSSLPVLQRSAPPLLLPP